MGQIVGIVVCAMGMLLSLIAASWQVFPLQGYVSPISPSVSPSPSVPGRTIDLETWKRQQQEKQEQQQPQPSPK